MLTGIVLFLAKLFMAKFSQRQHIRMKYRLCSVILIGNVLEFVLGFMEKSF